MPPDPDMIQSADEDDNSDPFADVKIDEDIDNAMKSWEGLMDKKHSKPKMKNVASEWNIICSPTNLKCGLVALLSRCQERGSTTIIS